MDDWAPGDKAVCVKAGTITINGQAHLGTGLTEDKIYHVEAVGLNFHKKVLLGLAEFNNDEPGHDELVPVRGGKMAMRFRKVRHDPEEGCKEDFVRLLNAHRSKQPEKKRDLIPVGPLALPYHPPKLGEDL